MGVHFLSVRLHKTSLCYLLTGCVTIDIAETNSLCFVTKGGRPMQAYCFKCRAKREMKDAKAITMKNGKPATQGVCPVCGTKMFRIGKS